MKVLYNTPLADESSSQKKRYRVNEYRFIAEMLAKIGIPFRGRRYD
jgi:hypothetical protein